MWSALTGLVFKLLAGLGAFFAIRQGGKTSQKLDDAQDTLEGVERRDEIKDQVRRDGPSAARKWLLAQWKR